MNTKPSPAQEGAHTAEPWSLFHNGERPVIIYGADKRYVGRSDAAPLRSIETDAANANRIVACVNACAGLNPAAVADVVEALESAFDGFEDYPEAADGHVAGEFSYRDLRLARAALHALREGKEGVC